MRTRTRTRKGEGEGEDEGEGEGEASACSWARMPLLNLTEDTLDSVLYLALLQPDSYDPNYHEVLYPRLVAVRAVCRRFNQEHLLLGTGIPLLSAVGLAAEQLRAVHRRHLSASSLRRS